MAKKAAAELEAEARETRRASKRADLEARAGADPDGEAWHASSRARWDAAQDLATVLGTDTLDLYEPVPLPDFRTRAPAHVTRELLGRFLIDRDTLTVHDVYAAEPACGIDGIRNGTFVHFLSELLETVEEETPCAGCMGG